MTNEMHACNSFHCILYEFFMWYHKWACTFTRDINMQVRIKSNMGCWKLCLLVESEGPVAIASARKSVRVDQKIDLLIGKLNISIFGTSETRWFGHDIWGGLVLVHSVKPRWWTCAEKWRFWHPTELCSGCSLEKFWWLLESIYIQLHGCSSWGFKTAAMHFQNPCKLVE